jgi:hypothetical protein
MAIFKVIEIMASSPKSWEDATIIAVKTPHFSSKPGSNLAQKKRHSQFRTVSV